MRRSKLTSALAFSSKVRKSSGEYHASCKSLEVAVKYFPKILGLKLTLLETCGLVGIMLLEIVEEIPGFFSEENNFEVVHVDSRGFAGFPDVGTEKEICDGILPKESRVETDCKGRLFR